jgi:putative transposase
MDAGGGTWDAQAGTIEIAILKLRQGTCYPGWLLERRRAERALAAVVVACSTSHSRICAA